MAVEFATSAAGVASGIGGSLANTALGAGLSFGLNAASTSKAHDRQKNMLTRGPTYIMKGLRDAGINPILAAGSSGFGGASARAPQAGSATVSGGNFSQSALLRKQIELTDAQTDATVATGAKALAEADITRAGQPHADARGRFFATEEGMETLRMQEINTAMPNTLTGAGARGLYSGYQTWKESVRTVQEEVRKAKAKYDYNQKNPARKSLIGPRPSWLK